MKIAICDDQIDFINQIKEFILEIDNNPENEIYSFCSGEDILNFVKNGDSFDILFLDIEMKGLNGIETARKIRDVNKKVIIVFITSYLDYAIEGYKVSALDYIQKPINLFDFRRLFTRIKQTYNAMNRKVSITSKGELVVLDIIDVLYVETRLRKVYVVTKDNEYIINSKFEDECEKFYRYNFVSVHRCCVVSMEKILKVSRNTVKLTNGIEVLISRDKQKEVLKQFSRFLME